MGVGSRSSLVYAGHEIPAGGRERLAQQFEVLRPIGPNLFDRKPKRRPAGGVPAKQACADALRIEPGRHVCRSEFAQAYFRVSAPEWREKSFEPKPIRKEKLNILSKAADFYQKTNQMDRFQFRALPERLK